MLDATRTPSQVDGDLVLTPTATTLASEPSAPSSGGPWSDVGAPLQPIPGLTEPPPAACADVPALVDIAPVASEDAVAQAPPCADTPAPEAATRRPTSVRHALPRLIGWEVLLDAEGRVIVGDPGERALDGRYLVVPQADGSLDLHLVESFQAPPAPTPEATPTPPVTDLDEEAAERELARWGRRALGDLGQEQGAAPAGGAHGPLPLVDPTQADRPQPAAFRSDAPEANRSHLSAVATDFYYWLVQNRDAHRLVARHRQEQTAGPAAPPPATPSP